MGTIFVAGTYGVGKSTLYQRLSDQLKIPAFPAGDLISAVNNKQYGANKVVTNKTNNQIILALQVKRLLKDNPRILLAGRLPIRLMRESLLNNFKFDIQLYRLICTGGFL